MDGFSIQCYWMVFHPGLDWFVTQMTKLILTDGCRLGYTYSLLTIQDNCWTDILRDKWWLTLTSFGGGGGGGAAVAMWLSSWLVEQEDRGSIPGLATWIFKDWLSPCFQAAIGLKYGWSDVNPQYNQPTKSFCGKMFHCVLSVTLNVTFACTGGHLIIGRTQLSDVASFRALQTRICEIWIQCRQLHEKLKPHRKNCQFSTNNKNFTVANVHPPFPSTICTYGGSEELQNLKLFF